MRPALDNVLKTPALRQQSLLSQAISNVVPPRYCASQSSMLQGFSHCRVGSTRPAWSRRSEECAYLNGTTQASRRTKASARPVVQETSAALELPVQAVGTSDNLEGQQEGVKESISAGPLAVDTLDNLEGQQEAVQAGISANFLTEATDDEVPFINIKHQWQLAARAAKTRDPVHAMRLYMSRMDVFFDATQSELDFKLVSSALFGIGKIWDTARQNRSFRYAEELIDQDLQGFLQRMLARLKLVLPEFKAREASNTLWAFSKLERNPDDELLLGAVDGLAQQFMADIDNANGHDFANLLQACAELQLNPCIGEFLQAILQHLGSINLSSFGPHAISSVTYNLARLHDVKPTTELLDALCEGFLHSLRLYDYRLRPKAQEVTTFAWALSEVRHVPSHLLSKAMVNRVLTLCHIVGQRPTSQAISTFMIALAELRIYLSQQDADALAAHLLAEETPSAQSLANTARSLAILGRLRFDTFRRLLFCLRRSNPSYINMEAKGQMHQALDWLGLQSEVSPQHHEAYVELQADIECLGPRPPPKPHALSTQKLHEALRELGMTSAPVVVADWSLTEITNLSSTTAEPVLVEMTLPDTFRNQPNRQVGRSVFRTKIMSKRTPHLIQVPYELANESVSALAAYLQSRFDDTLGSTSVPNPHMQQ